MTGKRIGCVRQYACEELEELMLFTPERRGLRLSAADSEVGR